MPVQKNKEYIVEIIDNGYSGEGIAKIEGFTIFIPNAIKGETIKILIVKVLTSHAFGKIIEIIKPSSKRVESDCTTYKRCGGCSLRHIDYKETLKMKQNIVQNLVNKHAAIISATRTIRQDSFFQWTPGLFFQRKFS